jgi:hypothetical protein
MTNKFPELRGFVKEFSYHTACDGS